VIAVRPGFVASEAVLEARNAGGEDYPGRDAVIAALDSGRYLTPEESARQIWGCLPPDPDGRNVYFIGEFIEGAGIDATQAETRPDGSVP
jgi:NAD(P)-dependent dehydrogenase (short-subunit alcohol dehydrogenase family)